MEIIMSSPPPVSIVDAEENVTDEDSPTEGACPHIEIAFGIETRKLEMQKKYKSAIAWSVANASTPAKRRKLQSPTCGTCGLVLPRPFICLHCSYGGCWKNNHILDHMKDLNHQFCADVKTGSVFCRECDDIIVDETFDEIFRSTSLHIEEKATKFVSQRKRREAYTVWETNGKDDASEDAFKVRCTGQLGLLNLGQTCFLNVILQSFLANPLLKSYFLSDMHNHKMCKIKECMCCELDKLFIELHSGRVTPFGPTSLLATTWKASSEIAGYAQQDAHEFLISALNQLHKTAYGNTSVSCNCSIHNIFGGQLQSDHTCEKCGTVSNKVEPILDVSLQLDVNGTSGKGKLGAATGGEVNTLESCLRRFTQTEQMKFSCSKCGTNQPATKRMSLRKIPPVLNVQFKRFEHTGQNGKNTPKKIEAHVRFPAAISLLPYTSLGIKASESEKDLHLGPSTIYEYDLFSVVVHEGQIDTGHYISFTRSQDQWFRFDDDKVSPTTLDAVLKSTAYMCFYVKRRLDYKTFALPTYKIARENEAVKEREKEKLKEKDRMREVEDALFDLAS